MSARHELALIECGGACKVFMLWIKKEDSHLCTLVFSPCLYYVSFIRIFVQEGLDVVTMVSITQSFGLNDFELRVLSKAESVTVFDDFYFTGYQCGAFSLLGHFLLRFIDFETLTVNYRA